MNGWRPEEAGCQPALSTLLAAGDRKLATVFSVPTDSTLSPVLFFYLSSSRWLSHSLFRSVSFSLICLFPLVNSCALMPHTLFWQPSFASVTVHKHTDLFLPLMNLFEASIWIKSAEEWKVLFDLVIVLSNNRKEKHRRLSTIVMSSLREPRVCLNS